MESHSANASAPCLLTAYGAAPGIVRRPAADTVARKWPRPRRSQTGSSTRAARTCAMTFTCQASSQSRSGASGPPPVPTPAFAQKRSMPPSSARDWATSAETPSTEAASPGADRPPTAAATRAAAAASRSLTTTWAPAAARRRASASPIPEPAPVTTARRPSTYAMWRTVALLVLSGRWSDGQPADDVPRAQPRQALGHLLERQVVGDHRLDHPVGDVPHEFVVAAAHQRRVLAPVQAPVQPEDRVVLHQRVGERRLRDDAGREP